MLSQLVPAHWVSLAGIAFVVLTAAFITQRKRERAAGGNRTVKELLKNIWHNGAGSPS
jgi:hypothetical protein